MTYNLEKLLPIEKRNKEKLEEIDKKENEEEYETKEKEEKRSYVIQGDKNESPIVEIKRNVVSIERKEADIE
ncbi:hypothetical protein F8M41_013138 [Gigaspora margarita]|uniref:Uncharacterized protein n=1 Tax=Gigaspora margarita TaxID=4874 RepID=A0A8H3ZZ38_GIGMA|nr:hypothetical protein F8M41_013138 [Gigaspora margarita]